MAKPGSKKNTQLKVVNGTLNVTRDKLPEEKPENASTGLLKIRDLPDEIDQIWEEFAPVLWWNTHAESHLFDTWCDMTHDLTLFKEDKKTRYNWTSAQFTQYRQIGNELGIGVNNRDAIPAQPSKAKSLKSEHFDD